MKTHNSIRFLGAAQSVGRSCFIVNAGQRRTMLDCGVEVEDEGALFPQLERRDLKGLTDAVCSHAHLDHIGYFPWLYKQGWKGRVTMTKPTHDMGKILLADFVKVSTESMGRSPYSNQDADVFLQRAETMEYNEWNEKGQGPFRFREAGHILGSAITEMKLPGGETLAYTGDIFCRESRLLEPAYADVAADYLVMEGTYGARGDRRPSMKDVGQAFIKSISETINRGGKVIVPTFATGRGQEILFTLENYLRSGQMRKVPVFIDGMVGKMLRCYRHNAVFLKKEMQRRILTSEEDPFKSPFFHLPKEEDRSDVIGAGPCVIVTTSGMLKGGPVLRYLDALGGDPRNKMILVGYQGEGTPGRAVIEGSRTLEAREGHTIKLRCQVERAPFSGHADHHELVQFATGVRGLKKVFVVHSEREKAFELCEAIESASRKKGRTVAAVAPELGEELMLR